MHDSNILLVASKQDLASMNICVLSDQVGKCLANTHKHIAFSVYPPLPNPQQRQQYGGPSNGS
ncbi:MAG: hypothetical protein NDP22_05560, partial [Crenarchaeota archaeon]|nr:hypothetical protein [Thermoproteota archaeon]